jgi:hypothetical protein
MPGTTRCSGTSDWTPVDCSPALAWLHKGALPPWLVPNLPFRDAPMAQVDVKRPAEVPRADRRHSEVIHVDRQDRWGFLHFFA